MSRMTVAVSDGASARFFSLDGRELTFTNRMEHPEGRAHARDLTSSRAGISTSDVPSVPHGYAPHSDPREVESEKFARRIAAFLDEEVRNHPRRELALAMPPRLLGLVRAALAPKTLSAVTVALDQRLIDVPVDELARRLREARDAQPRALD